MGRDIYCASPQALNRARDLQLGSQTRQIRQQKPRFRARLFRALRPDERRKTLAAENERATAERCLAIAASGRLAMQAVAFAALAAPPAH